MGGCGWTLIDNFIAEPTAAKKRYLEERPAGVGVGAQAGEQLLTAGVMGGVLGRQTAAGCKCVGGCPGQVNSCRLQVRVGHWV